jgi:O-methyltransferase
MLKVVKQSLQSMASVLGYKITRADLPSQPEFAPDFDREIIDLFRRVQPFTMTSRERIFALCESVRYVVKNSIPGDVVECGVWKGGSMMAAAMMFMKLQAERKLWLFDTFDGMPPPTDADVDYGGKFAAERMSKEGKGEGWSWAYGALDEVRHNLKSTGYPDASVSFIEGKVEDTIPAKAPEKIALLRLDTDWYESTYHELQHLYPRLAVGGVLIIDDYGHWAGARKAVDQYIEEKRLKLLLQRIDYTGRISVKLEP